MAYQKIINIYFLTFFLCGSLFCQAQNKDSVYTHTESRNENFTTVFIELEHFVELEISTTKEKGFYVSDEKQSGEYSKALLLNTKVANDTLFVTDPKNPVFTFPQDKLSAHKITDTRAILVLPENKNLFLNLVNSNVKISGDYKRLILNIHTGDAIFKKLSGDVTVISVNADVAATALKSYMFDGSSRNGTLSIKQNKSTTKYVFKVEAINGDIYLN